ncbi:MAG: hypothetical protein AAF389_13335 [Gemmatimonadota bacterium]
MRSLLRQIRGALGTALTWGLGWFLGGLGLYGLFGVLGVGGTGVSAVLQAAVNLGIIGGIAGLGFAAFIRIRYAGRALTDISTGWFGIGGGVASAVLVLGTVAIGRLLTGASTLEPATIAASAGVAATLGAITAASSLAVAKAAAGQIGSPDAAPTVDSHAGRDPRSALRPG